VTKGGTDDINQSFGTLSSPVMRRFPSLHTVLPFQGLGHVLHPQGEVGLLCLTRLSGVCLSQKSIMELGNGQSISCGKKAQPHETALNLPIHSRAFCFLHPLEDWSVVWSREDGFVKSKDWGSKP
jgi:hypothetical protein